MSDELKPTFNYEPCRDIFLRYMAECLSSPEYEEAFNKHYNEFYQEVDIFFEHDLLGIEDLQCQLDEAKTEITRLTGLITQHNRECTSPCIYRSEIGECKAYTDRGKKCPDCPTEWKIDL